jgi:hypothetical protein
MPIRAGGGKRPLAIAIGVIALLLIGLFLWTAISDGVIKALVLAGPCSVLLGMYCAVVYLALKKQIRDLKDALHRAR